MEMDTYTGIYLQHPFLPGYLPVPGFEQQRH
jgi:hypothetical protein